MFRRHCLLFFFLVALAASCIASVARDSCGANITIETVPIGDVGNPNDPATGNVFGGVDHAYNMGKYEVTVEQYTAFLNSVAAKDTYRLYNLQMAYISVVQGVAGIAQDCAEGRCSYSVIGSPNYPLTRVSWGDAARFANWLHNGQPTGDEGPGTTETGAYTLNGVTSALDLAAVVRNANAKWFIPTENEWYKAAYYQPAAKGGDSDGYWAYPMKTNSQPYSDQPPGATPDNTRVGNFYENDFLANGYDDGFAVTGSPGGRGELTPVGAYTSSSSYYGTFDQDGNVTEWTDTAVSNIYRRVRGGAFNGDSEFLRASFGAQAAATTQEEFALGLRVASVVPEPSTSLMAMLACGLGLIGRVLPLRTLGGRR